MNTTHEPVAVGDKVRWTHTSIRGRTMNMRLREGTVTAIDGDIATVKPLSRQAKPVQVRLAQLEQERKETAITALIETIADRAKLARLAAQEPT
jgi:hypothetical protein